MSAPSANPATDELYAKELLNAIGRTREYFARTQSKEGNWVAELEGDALLQSETIMLLAFLGEEDSKLARYCANDLVATQLPDGGWGQYPDAGADICNSVKAYFALKLTGHDPSREYMLRARRKIHELGGPEKINSFSRFYLAILGQIPHDQCPAVPPQMMLLPKWFPINIYAMSAWSRTIFVPLSIVSALRPVTDIPPEKGIRELFTHDPERWPPIIAPGRTLSRSLFSWDRFFRVVDKIIWKCRKIGIKPLHNYCIEKAKKWTLDRFEGSDGPGAIYPPIVWAWVALKALGYSDTSKEVQECRKQLEALIVWEPEKERAHLQPCKSPVWDTSLTLKSLLVGGLDSSCPMVRKGIQWIRSQQLSRKGDWSQTVNVEPGGWCFEFNNEFYPDNDDTAMALMVLRGRFASDQHPNGYIVAESVSSESGTLDNARKKALEISNVSEGIERGVNWLFAMQNSDGGWAAFDRDNTMELLCRVPFADHNAMIDPSSPDLTGRVLESLGRLGYKIGDKVGQKNAAIDRCVAYMRKQQRPDGSWFGRWGVNSVYGTWQGLTGLTAVGVAKDDPAIIAGKNWLLAYQHENGGWGESPNSYIDPKLRGLGKTTASQTAWGVMGLLAAGLVDHPATQRGIQYLLDNQNENGTWTEPEFTGTGFPLVFYLRYHYYPVYFPLTALSLYATLAKVPNLGVLNKEWMTEPIGVQPTTNIATENKALERSLVTEMKEYRARIIPFPIISLFASRGRNTTSETKIDESKARILKFDSPHEMNEPHSKSQSDEPIPPVPHLRLFCG